MKAIYSIAIALGAAQLFAQSSQGSASAKLWSPGGTLYQDFQIDYTDFARARVQQSLAFAHTVADHRYSSPEAGCTVYVPGSYARPDPMFRGEAKGMTQAVDYVQVTSSSLPVGTPVQIAISWTPSIAYSLSLLSPADASAAGRLITYGGETGFAWAFSVNNRQLTQHPPVVLSTSVGATFSVYSQLEVAAYAGLRSLFDDPLDVIADVFCQSRIVMTANQPVQCTGLSGTLYPNRLSWLGAYETQIEP